VTQSADFKRLSRGLFRPKSILFWIIIATMGAFCLALINNYRRSSKLHWAKEQAMPEIIRLSDEEEYKKAFALAKEAELYLGKDSTFMELWPKFARQINVHSDPPSAQLFRQSYGLKDTVWQYIGLTPLDSIWAYRGATKWKLEKDNFRTIYRFNSPRRMNNELVVFDAEGTIPDEMVRVPGGEFTLWIAGFEYGEKVAVADFLMDRNEVTNRDYKRFVDSGGYNEKVFWKYPFTLDGRTLSFDEAMSIFRDKTGRLGPASWEAGDYPDGEDDYPVSGVSWHEAAAFAEFAGKSLPTIFHWYRTVGTFLSYSIVP
jgi:hypothetical protein